jgi:serine/threonine-protein kinase RIO1
MGEAGYRMNSSQKASSASQWTRVDQNTILGPNNEIRTKHDLELQGQANAHRLELDLIEDDEKPAFIGNKAFNSFKRTMQKKTTKGVATQGQGRANADAEKTKQGALDGRVRIQITKAINNGLIEKFNGCVKEGKEALLYHADKGSESEGYDVAVKIFKRIQEFRNRGQYVDGDPRFYGKDFSRASGREQLEIWAEKEFRNLVRAHRAGVPVPKPLVQKENVLFMRFLGQDGWPSPQLRELEMKKGSKKWSLLYEQTMNAIQILYNDARLVHGDLSEYNILVCPSNLLLHNDDEAGSKDDGGDSLQIALIDFGQAVDLRHPDASELLRRDLLRVKQFFDKMGIITVDLEPAVHFVQTKGAPLR